LRLGLNITVGATAVDHAIDLPLDLLGAGQWADVTEVAGDAAWVGRMAALGIRSGCRLRVLRPGCPCLVEVGAARYCLRGGDCCQILVRPAGGRS
jgi:Fe2+ transport system protein FeoA